MPRNRERSLCNMLPHRLSNGCENRHRTTGIALNLLDSQLMTGAAAVVARCLAAAAAAAMFHAAPLSAAPVVVLTLDGAVSPATADYVVRGIRQAAEKGAGLVVLKVDTPGGLDTSMRKIIKEILAAPLPVATFVAPGGARAASAGTFILYASHIAAMAPATNLGAATPVPVGIAPVGDPGKASDESKPEKEAGRDGRANGKTQDKAPSKSSTTQKQVNDAAAYIRSLAQLRGRNADWGERAVREAVSLSAAEARELKVIDIVAHDVPDLLKQLNGRKLTVQGVDRTLDTAGAETIMADPDWRSRLLAVITDPSIALILMMIGIYGLIFEFSNPGFVLPGVVGAICLLLALFAFQLLPINYAGLGLIVLGLAFIAAEAFLPSFGALGIGGVAALVIGSVILIEPGAGDFAVPLSFTLALALTSAAVVFLTVAMAARARKRPVVSGSAEMVGARGVVLNDLQSEGWARVHGETWRVVSRVPLMRGQKIRVTRIDGLTLGVEAETEQQNGGAS
jgi:membrane-bound serine protease (ClpP class)